MKPSYTGWVDVFVVSDPLGEESYMPAAAEAQDGGVMMAALNVLGKYSFRFRPADNSASWSDVLTIIIRK